MPGKVARLGCGRGKGVDSESGGRMVDEEDVN